MIYFLYLLIAFLLVSVYFNLRYRAILKQRDEHETKLIKKAYFNPITNLPNKNNIDIVISEQITRTMRHKKSFLVVAIKITNYNDIKLRSKERAQDLLIEASDRILESIRDEDILSHITENGFIVVFNEYLEDENSDIIFDRINDAFKEKFVDEKGSIDISISIGKSQFPEDAKDVNGLINEANRKALI